MLISSGGQYPMVTLTRRGDEVMKGRVDYQLALAAANGSVSEKARARKPRAKEHSLEEMLPVDAAILERLRKLRLDLAREQGNVPAYIIFPDETLRAFARLKPASVEAGRKIRGVGEVKAQKIFASVHRSNQRVIPRFVEAISGKSTTEPQTISILKAGPRTLCALRSPDSSPAAEDCE